MKSAVILESEIVDRLKINDVVMAAELYKMRGLLYLSANETRYVEANSREAFRCFSEAIALEADARLTAFCLSKRASLNIAYGNIEAGIVDFELACTWDKNDSEILFEYGKALVYLERFEAAILPLKEALILRPQDQRIHEEIDIVIEAEKVCEDHLKDIKALMAMGRALNTGEYKGSGLHLWLQVVRNGDIALMPYLATQLNMQVQDGLDNTALHYAARFGHAHLIAPLLKYEIDPNIRNRDDLIPIEVAIQEGEVDVVQAFIDAGVEYPSNALQRAEERLHEIQEEQLRALAQKRAGITRTAEEKTAQDSKPVTAQTLLVVFKHPQTAPETTRSTLKRTRTALGAAPRVLNYQRDV